MHAEVAQQGKDGVPPRKEDQDSSRGTEAPEVGEQRADKLKGDVLLCKLSDGVLSGQGVWLATIVQFLL